MSHPGSAGLTSDRLGDANPFVPNKKKAISDGPISYSAGYSELPQSEADHKDGKLLAYVQDH